MDKTSLHPVVSRAKRIKNAWYPFLRRLPVDIETVTGHSTYTRFIILGRSRVGSNLLRGLLNAHHQITAFGEIFRDIQTADWDHMGYFQSEKTKQILRSNPAQFIDKTFFIRFPRYIKAAGFKIFYYHVPSTNIWPYLKKQTKIKVIHIKRKNILHTHVSRQKAMLTGEWVNAGNHHQKKSTGLIEIDYQACLEDFNQTRAWEKEYDRMFQSHDILEVCYESLSNNYVEEMRRIQRFLNVEYQAVKPATAKQGRRPLDQMIANYDELKNKFKNTPWEVFFEE